MAKLFRSKDAYALTRPGAKCSMFLPRNHRFCIIVAGVSPSILPIEESATWEIDIPPELEPSITEWPVLVTIVKKSHAQMFANMTGDRSTQLVRQARGAIASRLN